MSALIHAACITAVAADLLTRTYRLRWFSESTGAPIRTRDAFVTTSFGDAAAALTPWRAAGEPARVFGMTQGGATVSQSVVALTAESILNYLVVIAVAVPLFAFFGGDYWAVIPSPGGIGRNAAIGSVVVLLGAAAVWLALGRHASTLFTRGAAALRRAAAALRASAGTLLTLGLVASVASLLARLAILPMLALGASQRPSLGVLAVASFALLYTQLIVPSPSGAGVVDAAVLGGAAAVSEGTGSLLAAWRLYITILPVSIGILAAIWAYGPSAFTIFRRKP